MSDTPASKPILFPSGLDAKTCAERLQRIGAFPKARAAVRQVEGRSHNVVLTIGENILTEARV